jgi:hypothetical protein
MRMPQNQLPNLYKSPPYCLNMEINAYRMLEATMLCPSTDFYIVVLKLHVLIIG